jgi:predicted RNase H-like HicB family nuclease
VPKRQRPFTLELPIRITITKEDDYYIATFGKFVGGGTQGKTIKELMKNCAEVIELVQEVNNEPKKLGQKNKRVHNNKRKG